MGRLKDRKLIGKEKGPGKKKKRQPDPVDLVNEPGKYLLSIDYYPSICMKDQVKTYKESGMNMYIRTMLKDQVGLHM